MAGTVTLTGTLQNILGVADSGGSVTVNLANYDSNVPRVIGTGILVVPSVTVTAANGSFTVSGLYRNDLISPANTFYEITFISDTGIRVKQAYQLLNDGTYDVSILTPLNPTVPAPPTTGIFTSTSAGLVPASGGGTTNFLRADGVFAAPGGSFTSLQLADGSAAAPAYSFSNATSTGFWHPGGSSTAFSCSGTNQINFGQNIQLRSNGTYAFVNGDPFSIAADTGVSRIAAGLIGVGNGTQGNVSGSFQGNQFIGNALTQASPTAALAILDNNGVNHFFIAGVAPFTNTFICGNGSGNVFIGSAAKMWVDDVTGHINMAGATSGVITLQVPAVAGSNNITFPAATDTLVGKATTDTLTNKTFDTAGAGNVFKINGTQLTAVSGTGAVALVNSPSFTTPSIDVATGTSLTVTGNLSAGGFVHQSVSNANVTSVTVTGTTSQTALQAVTTASAELNTVGRWVTVRARGFHSTGATGGTITYTLKIGSTTLISIGSFNLANSLPNNAWYVEIDIMVQTAGASGALEVQANALLNNTASAAFFNSATISGIDLTGAVTFTLYSTASQTTTSTTSRMMGYQRNN